MRRPAALDRLSTPRWRARAVVIAALWLSLSNAARGADDAGQAGVAYDEITWRGVDVQPLAPGSFRADRETLMRRVAPADRYPDLKGNALGNLGNGTLAGPAPTFVGIYRYSYLGEWVRVDDLIAQTAIISRPDLGQTIFLNLSKKTYRTTTTPPSPAQMPAVKPSPSPTPADTGDVNYRIEVSATAAPPLEIDGMQAVGASGDGKLSTALATQQCISIQGSLHWVAYRVSGFTEPTRGSPFNFSPPAMLRCRFETKMDVPAATGPGDLIIYSSIEASMGMSLFQLKPIVVVTERGNIATLSASDAALFNIPADFTPQGNVST